MGRRHAVRRRRQLGDAAGRCGRHPGRAAARGAEGLCRRPRRDARQRAAADAGRCHRAAEAAPVGHRRATAARRALALRRGAEHRRLLRRPLPVVHPAGAAGGASAGRLPAHRPLAGPAVRPRPPRPRRWTAATRWPWRGRRGACARGGRTRPGLRGRPGRHRGRHRLRRRPGGRHAGGLDAQESVLRRSDARAGTVHVHFPRFGFQIRADKT